MNRIKINLEENMEKKRVNYYLVGILILIVVLIIAWKYELVGGVVFILAGILYIGFILSNIISTGFEWYYLLWAVQISGISFFIGILFLVNWFRKRK